MNEENIMKLLTEEPYMSQEQAARFLEISPGQVCNLIKKGKIIAYRGGKTPKPYIKSVINYKTNPKMKREK